MRSHVTMMDPFRFISSVWEAEQCVIEPYTLCLKVQYVKILVQDIKNNK